MRMRDFQIVLSVAELESFTKTAERLHLSQPAISLAVKRFEDGFGEKIFERHGNQVKLAPSGARAIRAMQKIHDIFQSSLGGGVPCRHIKIGMSTLLSGSSVALVVNKLRRLGRSYVEFEFMPSEEILRRDDLDVSIFVQSGPGFDEDSFGLDVKWIGDNNGVLIQSKKEPALWDAATRALRLSGGQVMRVIEVNDCFHAYQLAADGLGMTPCVMTRTTRFAGKVINDLPPLPEVRFRVTAEDNSIARAIQGFLVTPPAFAFAV